MSSGVIHEGIRQYNNAISAASDTSRPYFRKAKILINSDLFEEAREAVSKGLELDSESLSGQRLLIETMKPVDVVSIFEEIIFSTSLVVPTGTVDLVTTTQYFLMLSAISFATL